MMQKFGNHIITPGLYRDNDGNLFLLHTWAESGLRETKRPNAKRILFVYSIITGGDFTPYFGNYSELLAPSKAMQLCPMCHPMEEKLQREAYDNFRKNKSFAEFTQQDFASWAERKKWPLHISWLILHLLNWDIFHVLHEV